MITVISLSGSLIFDKELRTDYLRRFRDVVLEHVKTGNQVVIVTGGGGLNRLYNESARSIGDPGNTDLDWIGISVTRLNATLVRTMFGSEAYSDIVTDPTKLPSTEKKVIVASGWKPGWSTDLDAVILAAHFKARLINLTTVDYVYDKDPRGHTDAKPLKKIGWDQLSTLVGTEWTPRLNMPFDPVAVKEGKKASIKLLIINGLAIERLEDALKGKDVIGTIVG